MQYYDVYLYLIIHLKQLIIKKIPTFLKEPISTDPDSIIILPPDGLCEGGSMIDVYIYEVVSNSSLKIIMSLDQQMSICENARMKNISPSSMIPLWTPYDDIDSNNNNNSNSNSNNNNNTNNNEDILKWKANLKRKSLGRTRKWMGDLSLQVIYKLTLFFILSIETSFIFNLVNLL